MEQQSHSELDETGKIVLDDIYNQPDPRPYFSTLGELDYSIPEAARPVFANVLKAYRAAKSTRDVKVVDLGCSYGVNAALMKSGKSMPDLYRLYAEPSSANLDREELVRRDRRLFSGENAPHGLKVIGLDAAPQALKYAKEAGILDEKIFANLEQVSPDPAQAALLKGADLVVSTGCIGYISEKTITKVLEAAGDKKPWMAHFVLRMFSFEPIADALAEHGYVTARGNIPVRQRRFANAEEQEQVLSRLIDMGIDPSGLETEGWFYADFYLSRPADECELVPAPKLATIR